MQNREVEIERIQEAYLLRNKDKSPSYFSFEGDFHVLRIQERYYKTLALLKKNGVKHLHDKQILDIGCGDGVMLREMVQWGANPSLVVGIDLREDAIAYGKTQSPDLDLRYGSGDDLPFADKTFDMVVLNTVFSSIKDMALRDKIVTEIARVLKTDGGVLWYDFAYNNPKNQDVIGVKAVDIYKHFSGFDVCLQKITLAPPIARKLPRLAKGLLYNCLVLLPFLRTHYLGFFKIQK